MIRKQPFSLPYILMIVLLSSCFASREDEARAVPTLAAQVQAPTALPTTTSSPTAIPSPPTDLDTITPSPSITPIPTYERSRVEPTWGILFSGVVCPDSLGDCSNLDMNLSEPGYELRTYFILSDGSGLRPIEEISTIPDDIYQLRFFSFSQNDSRYTYWNGDQVVISSSENTLLSYVPFPIHTRHFGLVPRENCIIFFVRSNDESETSVQKGCASQSGFEELDRISVFGQFKLSPQADKFLVYDVDVESAATILYVKQLGPNHPLIEIVRKPFTCSLPGYRSSSLITWKDNQTIEFHLEDYCNNTIKHTFFTTDWQAVSLNKRLELEWKVTRDFMPSIRDGDWSPNGKEFVFSIREDSEPQANGLYLLDFDTGSTYQILSNYWITQLVAIPFPLLSEINNED